MKVIEFDLFPGDTEEIPERAAVKDGVNWTVPITVEETAQEESQQPPPE